MTLSDLERHILCRKLIKHQYDMAITETVAQQYFTYRYCSHAVNVWLRFIRFIFLVTDVKKDYHFHYLLRVCLGQSCSVYILLFLQHLLVLFLLIFLCNKSRKFQTSFNH